MKTLSKWVFRTLAALAILVLAVRVADRWARRSPALPEVPEPNGYAVLAQVARKIQGPEGDLADVPADAVRKFGGGQRELLDQVRLAVRGASGVPLETDPRWADKQVDELKRLKRLAVLVGLRSKVEMLEGRTNAAARAWVDMILLGQAIARGGRVLEALNGMAVEKVATASLRSMTPLLDAGTCRSLAQELERAESARESASRILGTESNWSRATFGLIARAGAYLQRQSEARRRADFESRYQDVERTTRRLILVLAAHSLALQTGRAVGSPSELVASVLQAVPVDPKTGAPFDDLPRVPQDPTP